MTPEQHDNTISTLLGTMGTVLLCVQLIPQIYTNYRRKSTEGLTAAMFILWASAGMLFGIYFIVQRTSVALMVQAEIFSFLSLVTVCQCLCYGNKYSLLKASTVCLLVAMLSAGLQLAVIIPLQNSNLYKDDPKPTCWPLLLIGTLSAICVFVGLLPPYFELGHLQGQVIGINFVFLAIDSTGAILSFASLLFPQTDANGVRLKTDVLGMVLYCLVATTESGIMLSHLIWHIRFGRHKQDTAETLKRNLSEPKFDRSSTLVKANSDDVLRLSSTGGSPV
ncbi:PQ loop repeat-domain-containing protein [Lipomyces arxii]|uniref:PQ loop repeat-domain-containing protein n=1 Tax=Lipomyces arxii TaxID=56418 RepID=UPI0034CE0114